MGQMDTGFSLPPLSSGGLDIFARWIIYLAVPQISAIWGVYTRPLTVRIWLFTA